MFEVFIEIQKTLIEMRDIMIKMERHLNDLTLPPNMREWSKRLKEKEGVQE
jgi:hypothetical protein